MDPQEFVETVRDEYATPLSRLGSSKALYADTAGEMDDDAVLRAAADRAFHAAETFDAWADDEGDGAVGEAFADAAATERDHADAAADERDDYEPGDPPAVHEHLRDVTGTVERLGAFVGWALAASNNTDQVVGYFVGQASPQTASTFRGFGDDFDAYVDRAGELLDDACEGDDWDRAVAAAGAAVEADYDDYFETLESLGVNPKPVC